MKTKLIILFAIMQITSFAQTQSPKTKQMITYYDHYKQVPSIPMEKFSVLVSNPTVFHGPYKKYGQNTVVLEEGNYDNGVAIGIWHYRNESDGFEYKTEGYNGRGEIDGEVIERSGKSKSIKHYKNGLPDGSQKAWNEAGILVKDFNFVDGKQHGKQMEYHYATGKPIVEAYYNNGKASGTWKYYNEDGDGTLQVEKEIENGLSILYDKNGRKISKGELDYGSINRKYGQWEEYNEAGVVIRSGKWNGYKKEGQWKVFNESGSLISVEIYNNEGILTSTKTAEEIKKENEDYQIYLDQGDEFLKNKDYQNALVSYNNALKIKSNEKYPNEKITETNAFIAVFEKTKQDELAEIKKISNSIDDKYKVFSSLYLGKKESMLLVDASTGKPVEKIDYLKGKNLYTKSEELYQTMRNDFESTKEYKSKIDTGNNIIDLLNKLVSLASKDTGDIEKQVKKAKSLDEIKEILMAQ